MKGRTKKICCYSLITLLALILPFNIVLAEETEKNINEEVEETEVITTTGVMEETEDDGKMTILGAENSSDTSESEPVTTTGDNPASVDEDQIIIPIAIGAVVLVAVIGVIITIKNKKNEQKEGN